MICGIDEAGRGPVIGPLVMVGVVIDPKDEGKLKELGVKDSKLLTKKKREELFDQVKAIAKKHEIVIVSPQEIDDAVLGDSNLNWLEASTSAKIIEVLKPQKVIVDCPSPNLSAYQRFLLDKIQFSIPIIAEHKADMNYVVVAAASILAKVVRDREIAKLKEEVGVDFGSGYLTDEKTQDFLKKHFNTHPDLFRKSWRPYKDLVIASKQKRLGEF